GIESNLWCFQEKFEAIFLPYDDEVNFQYFRSFHRARVTFQRSEAAATARIRCHQYQMGDFLLSCYFAQPAAAKTEDEEHLRPPSPHRQFLISPPASPPVGWEPVAEAQPCLNYDLLSAVAQLAPGESHELHPPSGSQPGIYVHVCEDTREKKPGGLKMIQTPCPARATGAPS
ncbi:RCAN2, partial [Cordylochernes scorpioides]